MSDQDVIVLAIAALGLIFAFWFAKYWTDKS